MKHKMKEIYESTQVGYTVNGQPVLAEQLSRWAYNQLSAAPELLEACKELLFDLQEHWLPKEMNQEDYPITAIHLKKAQQVISKAEG